MLKVKRPVLRYHGGKYKLAQWITTGMWVHGDEGTKPFVLCDECADDLYQKGKLGYGSDDAFLVSNS